MPECLTCRDGSTVCGNPPKCGGDALDLATATTGKRLERIEITVSKRALKVESTPAGFDFGSPKKIILEYANPGDPDDTNLLIRFID